MDKLTLIDKIISLLDEKDDGFLIFLLQQKKGDIKNQYNYKHSITLKEKNKAIQGMIKTVTGMKIRGEITYPDWYNKINLIIERSGCSKCKFYIDGYENSDKCNRCYKTQNKLRELQYQYDDILDNHLRQTIKQLDFLELKVIVNKIILKLQKLKNKNYDAS